MMSRNHDIALQPGQQEQNSILKKKNGEKKRNKEPYKPMRIYKRSEIHVNGVLEEEKKGGTGKVLEEIMSEGVLNLVNDMK